MAKTKLDKEGFILPLAVGALALIFFAIYFLKIGQNNSIGQINSVQDLNTSLRTVDAQNPDSFNSELNTNSTDASNF